MAHTVLESRIKAQPLLIASFQQAEVQGSKSSSRRGKTPNHHIISRNTNRLATGPCQLELSDVTPTLPLSGPPTPFLQECFIELHLDAATFTEVGIEFVAFISRQILIGPRSQ